MLSTTASSDELIGERGHDEELDAVLCSATAEAASYGRTKLKEEMEEVTELTERLKVARGSFVSQWR